jgi:hypothetical protein
MNGPLTPRKRHQMHFDVATDDQGKVEVHTHLPDGGRQMEWFMAQHGIRRQLQGKAFGVLLATQASPGDDRALVHAHLLSEGAAAKPLCGAIDGPWSTRGFDFLPLTCPRVPNPRAES